MHFFFFFLFSSYGLGPLDCSNSELISESWNPFRHLVEFLGPGITPTQGLYLHRTAHTERRGHRSMPRVVSKTRSQCFRSPKPYTSLFDCPVSAIDFNSNFRKKKTCRWVVVVSYSSDGLFFSCQRA
jgi:hypothetical protein